MKYSIIVPVYNMEKYISKCLDSIFSSTYKNYEVIIVNDGSTDKSDEIIKTYIEKNRNIIYIKEENMGLSTARNNGVSKATGDYIIFVDSDDYIEEKLLENIELNIDNNDVLRYQLNVVNNKVTPYNEVPFESLNGIEAFSLICKYKYIELACLYAIKREFFIKNNFKFTKGVYHEDYGLIPLVFSKAKSVKSISYIGYNYVNRNNSIMNSNDYKKQIKKMDDVLYLFNKAISYLNDVDNTQVIKSFYANSVLGKYNSLNIRLKFKYIKQIRNLKIVDYLSEDGFKRKIKKILYKVRYGVLV